MSILWLVTGQRLPVILAILGLIGLCFLIRPKQTKWILMFIWCFIFWFNYGYMTLFFAAKTPQFFFHDNCIYMLGLKFKALPGSRKRFETHRRNMIFATHRNMVDALIYDRLVHADFAILSRMIVAIWFPHFWLWSHFNKGIWFFKRGGRGSNLEPFYKWIDSKFEDPWCQRIGLYCAVEGHRNMSNKPLPLKKGMIKYAHSRKTLAQILIYFGHEKSIDQNTLSCTPGETCYYFIDEPMEPKEDETDEQWFERVQERFKKLFAQAWEQYQEALSKKTD